MIPEARLNTSPVSNSQPPKSRTMARMRSVRRVRRPIHSTATASSSAAGISQEIWLPNSLLNMRSSPVGPQRDPATAPPPTLPVSLPLSRPKPL